MKKWLWLAILLLLTTASPLVGVAFPGAPVKIEVSAAAGGGMDIVARALAERLAPRLGQPVLVSNRPGGGGLMAMMALKNAAPDGYTLALVPSWTLSYQPLVTQHYQKSDFTLLATLYRAPDALIARGDAPWNSVAEMLAVARASRQKLLFASQGPVDRLIVNWLARQTDSKIAVMPTKGGGEMIPRLLGGHVDFAYSATMHTQYVSAGKIKVLASLADRRQSVAPEVPTLQEQGWNIALNTFFITLLPRNTPSPIAERLAGALQETMADEFIRALIEDKLMMNIDFRLSAAADALIEQQRAEMRIMLDALQ